MENNFDIKTYLIKNKMTRNSQLLNEAYEIYDDEDNIVSSLPDEIELDEQESSIEDELMAQLDETEELDELNFNLKDDPNAEKGKPYIPKKFTLGDRQIEFLKKHGAKENKGTLYIPTELSGDLANRSSKIKRDFGFTFGSDTQAQQKSSGFLSALKNYFTKANSATIGATRYFTIPSNDGVYEFPNPYFMKENEEELEENWDDLDEEINAILEMDEQELSEEDALYTMDEFDESLNEDEPKFAKNSFQQAPSKQGNPVVGDEWVCYPEMNGKTWTMEPYDFHKWYHNEPNVFLGTKAECEEFMQDK